MARSHLAAKVTTLFRVLSEEESRKVTRWKAPDLTGEGHNIVNTRQEASPDGSTSPDRVRPLLGSALLKPGGASAPASSPQLQSISPRNVLAGQMPGEGNVTRVNHFGRNDPNVSLASAEMMQASYDEGYTKGHADGCNALEQQCVQQLMSVMASINKTADLLDDSQLEQEVLRLSVDIARLVIKREASIDAHVLENIVKAGIEQLQGAASGVTRVFLNPEDASFLRQHMQIDSSDTSGQRIVDDPVLAKGDCRIESGASIVNAGIDDWLCNVSEQLGLLPSANAALEDEVDRDLDSEEKV